MAASAEPKIRQLYEFGPFRLDPDKELLLREDATVPIAPKAFQILLVLIRSNKQVVTKDDLMKTIWPDTFVEEANLSRNIFLLRRALGESPQDHQYIVTVPGRGYRFAEDVQLVPDRELNVVAASHSSVEVQVEESRPWGWIATAAVVLIAAALGTWKLFVHRAPVLTEKDTVVLADFTNSTGDPVFDGTLRQGLEVQLQQSPFLNVLSRDRMQQTLRLMDKPPDAPLTADIAQEICERTGSAAVLEGSISSLGIQYVLGLKATDCRGGEVLDQEQAQAARKEYVLGAVGQMASRFRARVGESGATLRKHDVPLAQATTASLDALKAYSLGLQAEATEGEEASMPFFRHAIELDPKFAMAYAWLSLEYGSSGSSESATENIRKAYEVADHVSDNERFFIAAYYSGRATGNQEKARQICEEWAATYPREPLPHNFLAGFIDLVLARYDQARSEGQKGLELAPDRGYPYFLLGEDLLFAGRINDAGQVLREASERRVGYQKFPILQFDLAFLREDRPGMRQAVEAATPDALDWMADRQAFALAYGGQLEKARVLSRQAVEVAQQEGDRERAAEFAVRSAVWEGFFGDARRARQDAAAALATGKNREVEYGAAVALGLAGDSKQAEALAGRLENSYPEDTSVRFSYLPVLRAILALNRREPAQALAALEPATPYEMGAPRCAVVSFFGSLYPILLRGEADLAAHKGSEAAQEFQKLIDHRTVMIGDAVSVLAVYDLARSYALSGDSVKARKEYSDFLTLWKDADPSLPVLQQARAEYAKLTRSR